MGLALASRWIAKSYKLTPNYTGRWAATLTIVTPAVLAGSRCCPTPISPIQGTAERLTFDRLSTVRGPWNFSSVQTDHRGFALVLVRCATLTPADVGLSLLPITSTTADHQGA